MITLIKRRTKSATEIQIVLFRRRLFTIETFRFNPHEVARGSVYPTLFRNLKHLDMGDESTDDSFLPSRTHIKDWKPSRSSNTIIVQTIETASSQQHKGWASDMVGVLMELYPDRKIEVECPNEKSTGLFEKLHGKHPERIVKPPNYVEY